MIRIDVATMPAAAVLRLSVLAGFLAAGGCAESVSNDKRDDPALKASLKKTMEIYKAKTQAIKGNPVAAKRRP